VKRQVIMQERREEPNLGSERGATDALVSGVNWTRELGGDASYSGERRL